MGSKVPGGDAPPPFGSVSVEVIQETSEVFIPTNVNGRFPAVSNG